MWRVNFRRWTMRCLCTKILQWPARLLCLERAASRELLSPSISLTHVSIKRSVTQTGAHSPRWILRFYFHLPMNPGAKRLKRSKSMDAFGMCLNIKEWSFFYQMMGINSELSPLWRAICEHVFSVAVPETKATSSSSSKEKGQWNILRLRVEIVRLIAWRMWTKGQAGVSDPSCLSNSTKATQHN